MGYVQIDLLTEEEAKKLPEEILMCQVPKGFDGGVCKGNNNCIWWLRSRGFYRSWAGIVRDDGEVHGCGWYVDNNEVAVRPVLRVHSASIEMLKRTKKGYVEYLGTKWIDISEYVGSPCLLKKKCLKESHRFDAKMGDYDTSEIKSFLIKWYVEKTKEN